MPVTQLALELVLDAVLELQSTNRVLKCLYNYKITKLQLNYYNYNLITT